MDNIDVDKSNNEILIGSDRCWVHISNNGTYTITGMCNDEDQWKRVPAVANIGDEEYHARARNLGYDDSDEGCHQMSREHEAIHTLLALKRGEPFSPTLYGVAFPEEAIPVDDQVEEEKYVLSVQRYLNEEQNDRFTDQLRSEFDFDGWIEELREILRQQ